MREREAVIVARKLSEYRKRFEQLAGTIHSEGRTESQIYDIKQIMGDSLKDWQLYELFMLHGRICELAAFEHMGHKRGPLELTDGYIAGRKKREKAAAMPLKHL